MRRWPSVNVEAGPHHLRLRFPRTVRNKLLLSVTTSLWHLVTASQIRQDDKADKFIAIYALNIPDWLWCIRPIILFHMHKMIFIFLFCLSLLLFTPPLLLFHLS